MTMENVVVVRFAEPSKAYQALSVLKEYDAAGRIGLESAAVMERTATGELRVPESADNVGLVGTASGSLIGMLLGVLGGPVGLLLGWGTGALMLGAFDLDRAETSDEALGVLGRAIPPESTAVMASVEEPTVELIDGEMTRLGGEVTRRPVADVIDELEAAQEAADAAAYAGAAGDPASRPVRGSGGRDTRGRGRLEASGPARDARAAPWPCRRRRLARRRPVGGEAPGRSAHALHLTSPAFAPRWETSRSSAHPTATH
jgi:uncharacterized membrane protein